MSFRFKRVYDKPAKADGRRVPKKEEARVDEWLKEIAPSTGLRKWFGARPGQVERVQEATLGGAG